MNGENRRIVSADSVSTASSPVLLFIARTVKTTIRQNICTIGFSQAEDGKTKITPSYLDYLLENQEAIEFVEVSAWLWQLERSLSDDSSEPPLIYDNRTNSWNLNLQRLQRAGEVVKVIESFAALADQLQRQLTEQLQEAKTKT